MIEKVLEALAQGVMGLVILRSDSLVLEAMPEQFDVVEFGAISE